MVVVSSITGAFNMGCNCNKSNPVTAIKPIVSKVIHGATGLIKAGVGIGLAKSDLIAQRREICAQCEKLIKGMVDTCGVCQCVITAKTRLNEERCPLSKW